MVETGDENPAAGLLLTAPDDGEALAIQQIAMVEAGIFRWDRDFAWSLARPAKRFIAHHIQL